MKSISEKDSKEILTKMCEAISLKYTDIDFNEKDWFLKYSWTIDQENEFKKWLGKFLVKKGYCWKGKYRGEDHGEHEAAKILMNYGWKIQTN